MSSQFPVFGELFVGRVEGNFRIEHDQLTAATERETDILGDRATMCLCMCE